MKDVVSAEFSPHSAQLARTRAQQTTLGVCDSHSTAKPFADCLLLVTQQTTNHSEHLHMLALERCLFLLSCSSSDQ